MRLRTATALTTALLSQLCFAQASDAQFQEAMAVCDNMTLYVDAAKRQRIMGLPLATAREDTARLMQRNLQMDATIKRGAIELAQRIFDYVYAQEAVGALPTERVLTATCGTYRGYEIPVERVKAYVASTAQSAWDPLARVPLCTKVAQSVSNIAAGRDKGIPRERMAEVAASSLAGDEFTSSRLATLLSWAYDKPFIEIRPLHAYALQKCNRERAGKSYPALTELREPLAACAAKAESSERDACAVQILRVSE